MGSIHNTQELYKQHLSEIKGIKFTTREIDVISCILHNRGDKKIASILAISHRTVNAHVYNIISKLGVNSRENIIDFIEKSGWASYVKKYYICLLVESRFTRSLIQVAKTLNKDVIIYVIDDINSIQRSEEASKIINQRLNQLYTDLKLANVILEQKMPQSLYCILKPKHNEDFQENKEIGVLFDDFASENSSTPQAIEYVDFSSKKNYYFSVFDLLRKIISKPELDTIKSEFVTDYNALVGNIGNMELKSNPTLHETSATAGLIYNRYLKALSETRAFVMAVGFSILLALGIYSYYENRLGNAQAIIEINEAFKEFTDTFPGEKMVSGAIHENYPIIKTIEKKMEYLNKSAVRDYFSSPELSHEKLMNALYSLCELAIYYMYSNHHDGQKARNVLLLAKALAENQIVNRGSRVNFAENSAEDIYTELNVIKDLPEMYTKILYYIGRTYIYDRTLKGSIKYFELANYLGQKLKIFEGFSSLRSGIAIIRLNEIDSEIKDGNLKTAKENLKALIKVYKELINDNKQYKLDYKPNQESSAIIPKEDEYNHVVCIQHILKCYMRLISIEDDINKKNEYTHEFLNALVSNKEGYAPLISLKKIDQKSYRFASIINMLGSFLLLLYDSNIYIKELKTYFVKELNLVDSDDLYFIIQLFELAATKSRNTEYTKADAYNGMILVYERQLSSTHTDDEKKELSEKIELLKNKREEIYKSTNRKQN